MVLMLAWILGLAAGTMSALESAHALTQRGVGTVTAVRGEVFVSHPPNLATGADAPARGPLKFRDDVFFRDIIDTERESSAKLLLRRRADFTVRELSRVELREGMVPADSGRTRSIVALLEGAVRGLVQRDLLPHHELEIHTPNAVSAIRGTELIAIVFHPGTPVPPLPGTANERSGQSGPPATDIVSRFYVRKGLIEVEGVFASGGQGIEKVGNLPPRLFQFIPTSFNTLFTRVVLPLNPPGLPGNILSRMPAVQNDQAVPSGSPILQPDSGTAAPVDNVSPGKAFVSPNRSTPSGKPPAPDPSTPKLPAPDMNSAHGNPAASATFPFLAPLKGPASKLPSIK